MSARDDGGSPGTGTAFGDRTADPVIGDYVRQALDDAAAQLCEAANRRGGRPCPQCRAIARDTVLKFLECLPVSWPVLPLALRAELAKRGADA